MSIQRRGSLAFALLILLYAAYAGLYVYHSSCVINGERYFSLFDDAMISMRYARNLASGEGLVWNPGERVEGFTNPLWTLYMALLHRFPVPVSHISLLVQLTGLLLLTFNLYFVWRIGTQVSGSQAVGLSAACLTAFYLPLNTWTLQGMEVGLLASLLSAAVWQTIRCLKQETFSPWPYVLLGTGILTRIDMVVPFLTVWLFLAAADARNRLRHLWTGAASLAMTLLLPMAFRVWYYGELLPNTYYLNMTGYPPLLRMGRGVLVTLRMIADMHWLLVVSAFIILWSNRDRALRLLTAVLLAEVAYNIYVGGDAWEHYGEGRSRYLCVAMPCFFILFACSLQFCVENLSRWLTRRQPEAGVWPSTAVNFPFVVLFVLLSISFLLIVQSVSGLLILGVWLAVMSATVWVVGQIARQVADGSRAAAFIAQALTIGSMSISAPTLARMDTTALPLVVALSTWMALRHSQSGTFRIWPYLLLGAGMLVSSVILVPFIAVWLFLVATDRQCRARHLMIGALVLGAAVLFPLLVAPDWQFSLSPTTDALASLHLGLLDMTTGELFTILKWPWAAYWLILPALAALLLDRRPVIWLLVSPTLLLLVYAPFSLSAWDIGGDAEWLSGVILPYLFVLFAHVLVNIMRRLRPHVARVVQDSQGAWRHVAAAGSTLLFVWLLFGVAMAFNSIYSTSGSTTLKTLYLRQPGMEVINHWSNIREALHLREITTPRAILAVTSAGAIPYFSARPCVDLLGKCDARIAHLPMRHSLSEDRVFGFYPGHMKYDYAYSIGQRGPDVVVALWSHPEEAMPYLNRKYSQVVLNDGHAIYLRRDSPNILWDRVAANRL